MSTSKLYLVVSLKSHTTGVKAVKTDELFFSLQKKR